jgi:bacteriorhodopsin
MDLLLTAGMPWPTVLWVILVDEVMVVTGLVGALVRSSYKWGYFAFGCVALAYVVYVLVWEARRNANRLGNDVGKAFLYCGSLTAFLWIVSCFLQKSKESGAYIGNQLYPIAWIVCEGANVIAPDSEAIFYGILDLLAKPVFTGLLLWGHRNIDPARLGLRIRDYHDDPTVAGGMGGASHGEKGHAAGNHGATNGHHNGVTNGHHNGVTNGTHSANAVTGANVVPGTTTTTATSATTSPHV